MDPATFVFALPEIVLALGAMALLMVGTFRGEGSARFVGILAVALVIVALVITLSLQGTATVFDGAFTVDGFTRFVKALILIGVLGSIVMMLGEMQSDSGLNRFEMPVLLVLATLGMCMMVSAGDLIAVYLGLELQSLALYVIAALKRDSARASEAGLKYFVLGALSSGMLLYGMSLIYGFSGTVSFAGIADHIAANGSGIGLLVGLVFLTTGLAFKVSAVPFHMWTPDVYEGAPTPVTAFLAAAPKVAALALFVRAVIEPFAEITGDWRQILSFLAVASMLLGAFAAIGQTSLKRLMAYSSIGHMGFALVGLAAGTVEGVQGVLIYAAIYLSMTLGTFAVLLAMRRPEGPVDTIADLSGLARTRPLMALALGILMFSLAGIPPLAGFFAKFYVFAAAVEQGLYALAIVGVLASVVGAFYYLRIVKVMYFDEPAPAFEPTKGELGFIMTVAAAFVTLFIVMPGPLVRTAEAAAKVLFP
ncbi:MAG: NADH-quinone oxidoreductase subunit NuoN [Alphaproteobacteria bacterium]|nr:NADH-quinone oxidoreductase subunit NuoN [Alphaproteobacteria bacterium]MDX5370802.1 NADH-quinone oxidoreductase subunit NuoN [Alphaproteobacteria bacterium]MDX5465212.1 NADH-quinone oxidoreductase subunit NuoN [Alphaproteobacteria bacterium]